MAFAVELEEWVGAHWHRFITRHASGEFEAARVTLESMRRPLGMLFRRSAAHRGSPRGDPGAPPAATPHLVAAGRRDPRAGPGVLVQRRQPAPAGIPRGHPQAELNRELYRWLALLAASAGPLRHWAQDNQRWARQLLDAYPALRRATPGWSPRICASARRWTIARRQTPNWKSPCAARLPSRAASSASRESSGRPGRCRCGCIPASAGRLPPARRTARKRPPAPASARSPAAERAARRARRGARQRAQPAAVPPGKPAQLVGAPGPGPL